MIVSGYSQREIKSIISKNTFCSIRAFNQLVFGRKYEKCQSSRRFLVLWRFVR